MAELEVIYDPAKELAAIVNVETREGWGPAMIGPNAAMILTTFLEAVPFDISNEPASVVTRYFLDFLSKVGLAVDETPAETPAMETQPSGDSSVANADYAAQAEAVAAPSAPAPQPADTDMAQPASTAGTVVPCVNCNGSGTVAMGEGEPSAVCGMCNGTGKLTLQPVPES